MSRCCFNGCPRPTTTMVRFDVAGPSKPVCDFHLGWMNEQAMYYRTAAVAPEAVTDVRPMWLRRGLAKDLSGNLR